MFRLCLLVLPCWGPCLPVTASIVVVSAVPDEGLALSPLRGSDGLPLPPGSEFRLGGFPGRDTAALLDAANTGGYAAVAELFVPFGPPCQIGNGTDGEAGRFEVSVREPQLPETSPLAGEDIFLVVSENVRQEYFVARFPGKTFAPDSESAVEPLLVLHLSEARLVLGATRPGPAFSTLTAPLTGSFAQWIGQFPELTTDDRLPLSDPDHDGRSNLVEYATGGNPVSSAGDPPVCGISRDSQGDFWIHFPQRSDIGTLRYEIETTDNPSSDWQAAAGVVEMDPSPQEQEQTGLIRLRLRIPSPLSPLGLFRLKVSVD